MSETHELNPITPYCVSKLASEYLLKFFSRFGLKYTIFRYFNVYGIRQHTDAYYTSVIIIFLKKLLNGETPIIDGNGKQSMDFVNVKDVVRANIMAMESNVENEIFNVGTGKTTSIREIAYMLIEQSGKNIEPIFKPREVIVTERRADVRKAKEMLGFEAEIDIQEGLKEVTEDIIKNPGRY
jgi:UDP-glucose 4-epimerase